MYKALQAGNKQDVQLGLTPMASRVEKNLNVSPNGGLFEYLETAIPSQSIDHGYVTFIGADEIEGFNHDVDSARKMNEAGWVVIGYMSDELYAWHKSSGKILGIVGSAISADGISVWNSRSEKTDYLNVCDENVISHAFISFGDGEMFFEWLHGKYLLRDSDDL